MDEKDWYILKMIYEEKNITRSAERLHTSQPALTYRLNQIQDEFSSKIFSRGKSGIRFTPEGELIVSYANNMIAQLSKLKDQLANMNEKIQGELRIGVSSNYAHYKLPSILEKFLSIYPDVQVKVNTGWSSKILKLFQNEELHIGIIRGDYQWDGPKLLLDEDPMCLISKDPIDINELPKHPRISYKTDQNLKFVLDKWWQSKFNEEPLISMEVDRLETCKEMVKTGLGYGIIPSFLLENENNLFIQNITTPDHKFIYRKLWMFYHANEMNLSAVRAFVEFIRDFKGK